MTNLPEYDDGWRAGYKLGRWQMENYWSRKAAEMARGKPKDPNKILLMVDTTAEAALAFQERAKAEGKTISELFTKLAMDETKQTGGQKENEK